MTVDDQIRMMIRYELHTALGSFSADDPNNRITELMRQREQDRKRMDYLEQRIAMLTELIYTVADATGAKI